LDSEPAWQQRVDVWYWPEEEQKADTVSQFLMRRSLTKKQIIRLKADIDNLFKAGKRYSLSCFKLFVAQNDLPYSRLIVIPARHYGNSVQRNLIRRQIKEIWRVNQERISSGLDFAVVVYPTHEKTLTFGEKKDILIDLFRKSGSIAS
jgi:ribonuclease P protein component